MATGRVPTTANSPLTAKGDLFGYSTTQARVAVGNDGETLVADSSASTGLRYQTPVQQNPVLNSAYQIWSRGTSGTANSYSAGSGYNADRWQNYSVNALTVSRQVTGDTTNLPNIQYCTRVQRNAGQTSTGQVFNSQTFESINSIPFVGKTVTLSFYGRKGANYSEGSSNLTLQLITGTGTDQNVLTGFTAFANTINTNMLLTTTWQRFTATATVPTTTTQMGVGFVYTPSGTAGAADYFEVTGVQLEVGSVATPFKTYATTIQGELAACQRYYTRFTASNTYSAYGMGIARSSQQFDPLLYLPVTMRTAPTSVDSNLLSSIPNYQGAATSITSIAINVATPNQVMIQATSSGTGLTQNSSYYLAANNSTSSYIGVSAEL
jgi:hypothetical protein